MTDMAEMAAVDVPVFPNDEIDAQMRAAGAAAFPRTDRTEEDAFVVALRFAFQLGASAGYVTGAAGHEERFAGMLHQLAEGRMLLPTIAERTDGFVYDELASIFNDGPLDDNGDDMVAAVVAQIVAEQEK